MVEIGRFNTLTVVKIVDFGVYLDGGERGEILMPKEYVPANCFPDDEVKAFVYFDSVNCAYIYCHIFVYGIFYLLSCQICCPSVKRRFFLH